MPDHADPLKPWQLIRSQAGPDLGLFRLRYDFLQDRRSAVEIRAVVLETPDWVDVVAVTPEGKIVVIDQHRFGMGGLCTEIPAGTVNPGETPEQGAKRELLEEAGYQSSEWRHLGAVQPNPAFHDNLCHQFLARGATKLGSPNPDGSERITVRELTVEQIIAEVRGGQIKISLALLALSRVCSVWGRHQAL